MALNSHKSLIGEQFYSLTVTGLKCSSSRGRIYWTTCSCGTVTPALAYRLTQGLKKSCGCLSYKNGATKKDNKPKFKTFLGLPVIY